MRVSLNWLKSFVDIPVSDRELVELIGARLVEVEGIIDETHKYDNIYVVRVEKAKKIPDTHLTLCMINVGNVEIPKVEKSEDGLIQVLCGAPNVHEGMLAAWIAPGATVPASVHEDAPFVIGKRKMLGKYVSNGMLAGADELDFSDNHDSIAEIDPEKAKPGDLIADVFDLNDWILEIENKSLTHRPDCFGMIGFAREVAGILGQEFEPIIHKPFLKKQGRMNSFPDFIPRNCPEKPKITIADGTICPRYTALILEKHGELTQKYLTWQDTIIAKSGMRPIEPIVDATNYLMLLTGQPLHAFDYDKFVKVGGGSEARIVVRLARKGEKLVLLDEKEIELNENDIVICSGDVPVALAGAMGGKSTMVDAETRNIIIESATFSLYNLRKTQMTHGIFSEAITRFTKGLSPYQTMMVAVSCAKMLQGGFKVVAKNDMYPKPVEDIVVKITTNEINGLLGTNHNKKLIIDTLSNVGFVVKEKMDELNIVVPVWRTDIHIKEDIIEEVGRLLGYDNIKPTLPLHATADTNEMLNLKRSISYRLKNMGANELLTYSFVSGRLLDKVSQDRKNSYKIVNSISPDLQYIRQSIVPSLLDKTYMNEKLPVEKFAIFEINKVYRKELGINEEKVPAEKISLGFVVAERKNSGTAYYKAKKYVEELLSSFGIKAEYLPMKSNDAENKPFESKRSADIMVGKQRIGVVGEFKNSVKHEFKLAPYVAGFEIDLNDLLVMGEGEKIEYRKYTTEDLTITTDKSYAETLKEVQKQYPNAEITPGVIFQAPTQTTKNMTFHIKLML